MAPREDARRHPMTKKQCRTASDVVIVWFCSIFYPRRIDVIFLVESNRLSTSLPRYLASVLRDPMRQEQQGGVRSIREKIAVGGGDAALIG